MIISPRRRSQRRVSLSVAALAVLMMLDGWVAPVQAQTVAPAGQASTADYDLPPALLPQTVAAIARISGLDITLDPAVPGNLQAPAVRGRMSALQATRLALTGTGLTVAEQAGRLVISTAQTVTVVARRDAAELSFKADRSDTATRSGTNLMDVPLSVSIITAQVLQSQQVTSTLDALRNVSGVGLALTPQGQPEFSVRGFTETSQTTNGIADRNAVQTDVGTIERIEVLKGPQAILAGSDSLGGGLNIVTKRPTTEPVRTLGLQLGTGGDLTLSADLGGALSENKRWSYRLIGASARSSTTSAGFEGRRSESLMPALRFKDDGTDLTLSASYSNSRSPMPEYTFASADGRIAPPPDIRLGTRQDGLDNRHARVGYELEKTVTPSWTLVSRVHQVHDRRQIHLWSPFTQITDDNGAVTGLFGAVDDTTKSRQLSGDHYARLQFETGAVRHKLSVGFGHDDYRARQLQYEGDVAQLPLYPAGSAALADPRDAKINPFQSDITQRQRAVYMQDLMSAGDWSLLLNLRRTRYQQTQSATFGASTTFVAPLKVTTTTPGAGVVYRWSEDTSLYASYSEGFLPQSSPLCAGGIAPPVQSRNKELGAKYQLLGGRLSLTSALFEVQQSNFAVVVLPQNCVELRPARKTQGLELDVQGDLARGWSVVGNYTFGEVSDVRDPNARIPAAPRHKLSLWSTYQPGWARLPGLSAGLGLTASSRMAGNSDPLEPFDIPGQAQLDASIAYAQPGWNLTLGIKNLGDRRLYGASVSNVYVPVLQGRSYMLTLQRRFD